MGQGKGRVGERDSRRLWGAGVSQAEGGIMSESVQSLVAGQFCFPEEIFS